MCGRVRSASWGTPAAPRLPTHGATVVAPRTVRASCAAFPSPPAHAPATARGANAPLCLRTPRVNLDARTPQVNVDARTRSLGAVGNARSAETSDTRRHCRGAAHRQSVVRGIPLATGSRSRYGTRRERAAVPAHAAGEPGCADAAGERGCADAFARRRGQRPQRRDFRHTAPLTWRRAPSERRARHSPRHRLTLALRHAARTRRCACARRG